MGEVHNSYTQTLDNIAMYLSKKFTVYKYSIFSIYRHRYHESMVLYIEKSQLACEMFITGNNLPVMDVNGTCTKKEAPDIVYAAGKVAVIISPTAA